MKNDPIALVINVTLRCPLKCAHCCYSSDMSKIGHLSLDDIKAAISQAAATRVFDAVHFVGGDPLLHPELVREAIEHAAGLGLHTGITTSAFWAKSRERALGVVAKLKGAGLSEITLSYDDAHAQFLEISHIANAVWAAIEAGLKARIAVVVEPDSQITPEWLCTALELDDSVQVYETAINSTGRAADIDADRAQLRKRWEYAYRGPCTSVLRNFQVDPEGNVYPCCGVLPHRETMAVGHVRESGLNRAMQEAEGDALLQWIRSEGPVEVIVQTTADDPSPLQREDFDGVCTACDRLYSSIHLLSRARALAEQREKPVNPRRSVVE
ncbi:MULTISPECIES: radical SAM protein [unclassified Paraburkholderia]|uniref:radical SAM/SPASM domain-containing protein n=1 Tax=unclassified Paraburkholderia TaxID=2615204 RepID=UPI002AB218F2|nr:MULTISPECIES: radical SAM protein [unclassified Paraburkholderia]